MYAPVTNRPSPADRLTAPLPRVSEAVPPFPCP